MGRAAERALGLMPLVRPNEANRMRCRRWFSRRRLLNVGACLFIGIVINVGVAWWAIVRAQGRSAFDTPQNDRSKTRNWPSAAPDDWPDAERRDVKHAEWGPTWGVDEEWAITWGIPGSSFEYQMFLTEAGWPWHSLRAVGGWRFDEHTKEQRLLGNAITRGLTRERGEGRHRKLTTFPMAPIPLGFAANSILFASLIGLPIGGVRRARRALRVRRGLCIHCAYPLGTSTTCPECGTRSRSGQPADRRAFRVEGDMGPPPATSSASPP
jgi:hypothetical protein